MNEIKRGSELCGCFATLPFRSYNTVYAVCFAHPNCAFGTTPHTPIPLSEIGGTESAQ